ncbi:MAG: CaiB/BaiF CoA-transferase family protein [Alphaproteobacteria bacterium]|jgi:crotonobetainyl-CoA:carnitine CoA-transferase CaiB-like acyl-CoA transferase|nr:CaiB/BaiF CoA-transferase family protein [Alphaproteobacteria bacterium]
MAGPLNGIRVIELTTMITGSLCGQMLADMGADSIKIEKKEGGDMFRSWRGGTYSAQFGAYNRNKRSMTLDIRSDEGREILLKLVETADVLVENFRPGVMKRLKLSVEELRERNPKLIYCSISGFGEDGPYEKRPAYDAVAQSLSGIASLFVDPETPQTTGPTISDNITGINACYGIMAALFERERGGPPRSISVNMLESSIWFLPDPFANLTQQDIQPSPTSRSEASQSHAMRCSDGKLMAVHISSQEKFWQGVTGALGVEHMRDDPRYADRMSRIAHYFDMTAEFKKAAIEQPRAYWVPRLEEADVPYAPINTLPDVFDDPQVKHLDTFFEVEHPEEGKQTFSRRAVYIDGSRDDQPMNPPPQLGEHTDEVLSELGVDADAMKALRDKGVV